MRPRITAELVHQEKIIHFTLYALRRLLKLLATDGTPDEVDIEESIWWMFADNVSQKDFHVCCGVHYFEYVGVRFIKWAG